MCKSELIVSSPRYSDIGDSHQVAARIRGPGIDSEVWFRSKTPFAEESPYTHEAFLATALYPAMRQNLTLRVGGAVSERLMLALGQLQKFVWEWYPGYHRIDVVPDEVAAAPADQSGAGAAFFFSGGVDSFHTYLGNRDELTHALFIHGADIKLDRTEFRALVSGRLGQAAREMGVDLIEVETNLLDFTDQYCTWADQLHGAGLAAVAKLFADRYRKVSIASSSPLSALLPWGSHPFTDPLWSSDGFEVLHHGAEATRFEKVAAVSESELAMRYVRVCWENVDGRYNCCRCEKCLRTMAALRILGALDRCPAFPEPIDCSLIPAIRYMGPGNRCDWAWNIRAAEEIDDPELKSAMAEMDAASDAADAVKQFSRHSAGLLASPEWHRLLPKVRNKLFRSLKAHDPEWFGEKCAGEIEGSREKAFDVLWRRCRKWLKRRMREAERSRRAQRLRSALRRIGIGKG